VIDPDPNPADSLTGWKVKLVKQFILANPTATIREVAKATRASERTVSRARDVLVRGGLIPPAAVGRPLSPNPESDSGPDEEKIRRDIDAAVRSGAAKVLTREERRQRLSAYADHPQVPHASRIAALRELEATEPPSDEKTLGPGAPLTRADRVHRVSLMVEALADIDGQGAVMEALARGLGEAYVKFTDTIAFAKGGPDAGPVQRPDAPDVPLPEVRDA